MLELLRYFLAVLLDHTWELESQREVERDFDGPHKVMVHSNGPLAFKLMNNHDFPDRVASPALVRCPRVRSAS